jgi:heme exporter protein A
MTDTALPPLLLARGLRLERQGRVLWRSLDLALRPAEQLWLRGPNGCGKTTLLRTLAGLRAPARGQVQRTAALRWLSHAHGLKDELTLDETLTLEARLHAAGSGQRAPSAQALAPRLDAARRALGLERLGARACRTLSQGQRRRAALATLLLDDGHQPPAVWLLDEPFDALDDDGVQRLHTLIDGHLARGGAVLYTSHQDPGRTARTLSWTAH